ncbi:MAG: DUF4417 domain-containing protein [Lachnospiraceae bacterium]|nr:DUF4417 domain-containing protein [Lachnospiraceae bacterium]
MMSFRENPRLDVFESVLVKGARFSKDHEMPLLKRSDFKPTEGIPFNIANKAKHHSQWLHFYTHDYLFERVWKHHDRYLPLFRRFQGVITPDYSLYREMPLPMQCWNAYRNRALAYWLQGLGINTVPNVRWGDERTYGFVFEGLPKGGTFAICTNGCIETKLDRYYFKKGLAKLVELCQPDTIVNYSSDADDIFGRYREQGIEIIALNYWRDAFRKVAN